MVALKGLSLPERLVELVMAGQWRGWLKPAVLQGVAPGMNARIELCDSFEFMLKESPAPGSPGHFTLLRQYLGSEHPDLSDLPWLDMEKALFIAVGSWGDDTGFALDYRINPERPRVVGGFWRVPVEHVIEWKCVAESFDEFARKLGL